MDLQKLHEIKKSLGKLDNIKEDILNNTSFYIGKPLSYPRAATLLMTYRCNLRCVMCYTVHHSIIPGKPELTDEEFLKILKQLKEINIKHLTISGGEPLVRKDLSLELIKQANKYGIQTSLITNGVLWDKKTCKEFYEAGLNGFTVSIDGSNPETHDKIRAIPSSFNRSVETIKYMLSLREKNRLEGKYNFGINTITVIMKSNFRELIDIYNLFSKMDIDGIMYQAVSKGYPQFMIRDIEDIKEFEKVIDKLLEIKHNCGKIINDDIYFNNLIEYFTNPNFDLGNCLAGYKDIIINPYGEIDICGYGPYGISLKEVTLKELWKSKEYKEARIRIKNCDRKCLYLCYKKGGIKNIVSNMKNIVVS